MERSLSGIRYLSPPQIGAAVLFLLVVLACAWDGPAVLLSTLDATNAQAGDGDLLRQVCFLLLFAATLVAIVLRGDMRLLLAVPVIFLPLLGWCWLSLIWAINPDAALRRISFTTIIVITVSYAVQLMPYRRSLDVLLAALCCVMLANWAAIAFFPLAVHQPDELDPALIGNWRGIHKSKNETGAVLTLCAIMCVHEAIRVRSYLSGLVLVVLAAVFVYQTHSKTSGAVGVAALGIGVLSHYSAHNPRLRQVIVTCVLIIALLSAPYMSDIIESQLRFFDDPASLTGRVELWPVLLDFAADHPLLGSGYGSFWGIGGESPIFRYGSGWVTTVFLAHNGYLDLLIQLGAIGLVIAVTSLVFYPFYDLFCRPLPSTVPRTLLCSVLAFGCLRDLLETTLLDRANPTWLVMLVMYALLFKGRTEMKLAVSKQ
jgi:O-antigen ligase